MFILSLVRSFSSVFNIVCCSKCLLIGFVLTISPSYASDWYFLPNASVSAEYDDNPLLRVGESEDAWGRVLKAEFKFGKKSPRQLLQIRPRVVDAQYDSPDALDYDDEYIELLFNRLGRRSKFNLNASYASESTRTSELLDSGRIQFRVPVDSIVLQPSWEMALSRRDQLAIAVSGTDVDYDDDLLSRFIDYQYSVLNIAWSRNFGSNTSFNVSAYGTMYEADSTATQVDTTGLDIGFLHRFTEQLTLDASIGGRETTTEIPTFFGFIFTDTDTGNTLDFAIDYELPRNTLGVSISRSVSPSSFGVVNERDDIVFSLDTKISKKLSGNFKLRYLENRSITESAFGSDTDREYTQFVTGFSWQIGRHWRLSANYRFNQQEFESDATAESNLLRIKFGYNTKK